MSFTVVPVAITGAAGLFTSDVITSTTNGPPTINAATATHITDGCVPGDAAVITSSASNNGTYIIVRVVSETAIEVYPPLPVPGGASGTLEIRRSNHELTITDENTISCTSIAAAMASLDSRLFFRSWGTAENTSGGVDLSCFIHLFRQIKITRTTATLSTWTTKNEIIACYYDRQTYVGGVSATSDSFWRIVSKTGSTGDILLVAGELATSDYRSARYGSMFLNGGPVMTTEAGKMATQLYNCKFTGGNSSTVLGIGSGISGTEAHAYGCHFGGAVGIGGTGTARIKRCTIAAPNGLPLFTTSTPVLDVEDLLIGDGNNTAITTLFNDSVFENLDFSDTVATSGLFNAVTSSVTVDDLAQDLTMQYLFVASSGNTFLKRYTFNPRFVNVNHRGKSSAINGLKVKVEKVCDGHYINPTTGAAGTWSLSINGTSVNVTGSSTLLTVQTNIVSAINAAGLGVTAVAASNGSQIGGSAAVLVFANVDDTQFSIILNAPPPPGVWALDPAPNGGTKAATAPENYLQGAVSGSPFTTDSNGRINTTGIKALRGIQSETTHTGHDPINVQLRITVEGAGYERQVFYFIPTGPFRADFPVQKARMGNLV